MKPQNIFKEKFATLYGSIPFSKIKETFCKDAILSGIQDAKNEIQEISNNIEPPTFENTIVALERSGENLERVLNVFYPLLSAASDDYMMALSSELSPIISDFSTSILLNEKLWDRIKSVYESARQNAFKSFSTEDKTLLQKKYDAFRRNGALLSSDAKESLRDINAEISKLTTLFGQNVLKELQTIEIPASIDELTGIPERVISEFEKKAKSKDCSDKYLITLEQPNYIAILKYARSRKLREKIWRIYNERNTTGEFSNLEVVRKIANLRLKKAQLLGYQSYADFSLERTMAKNKENVIDLLNKIEEAYRPKWNEELIELKKFALETDGFADELKPWDYSYYNNLLINNRYRFDEEELRPFFPLERVIEGLFFLAKELYGLSFTIIDKSVEIYENDVKVYRVDDIDGSFLGLLYMDFFPRPNKRSGAWMTTFREQEIRGNENIRPLVSIVANITKPTESKPSLLSPSEVRTLLHEFGHALHGLLAQAKYASLSGTNVERDFVELPSQFNENFLLEKEFLKIIGRHFETGEKLSDEQMDKIILSNRNGVGYACLRQLQFGLLDMAWHSQTDPIEKNALDFESEFLKNISPFPPEPHTSVSTQFNHIFSGGYAAGYYSYKWSEVLDADAFSRFKEEGIFNKKTSQSFRKEILERGGTEDPDVLYKNFRGRQPDIAAMLIRDGLDS